MRTPLLAWFDADARAFPWRRATDARDPYRVLVAETLLQQTQASRAAPAYERFVARFPTPAHLAAATSDEVLRAWQGLGYYARAHRLRAAAIEVVRSHGGHVPSSWEALRNLPGVGRYTARAVAARAFGAPLIAVDANVRRVGARVLGLLAAGDATIETELERTFDVGDGAAPRAGDLTEALIELGATRCRPRTPRCDGCPLRGGCRAAASGRPEAFPAASKRGARNAEALDVAVHVDARGAALRRRPEDGRWAGLWGFPPLPPVRRRPTVRLRHVVTNRVIDVRAHEVPGADVGADCARVPLERIADGGGDRPVSVLDQRVARALLALRDAADGPERSGGAA